MWKMFEGEVYIFTSLLALNVENVTVSLVKVNNVDWRINDSFVETGWNELPISRQIES